MRLSVMVPDGLAAVVDRPLTVVKRPPTTTFTLAPVP